MTNVLPPADRLHMWIFFRTRFIKAGSIALVSLALLALVSIAPSYILLTINKPLTSSQDGPAADTQAQDKKDAQRARALIGDLLPIFAATTTPMDLIEKTLLLRPEGVTVSHISYTQDGDTTTVVLRGTTSARGQAESLRKALEDSGYFQSVSIPVNDLIGAGGNQFTVTLKLKKSS